MPDNDLNEKKRAPAFSSWGRYPVYQANLVPLFWQQDFPPFVPPHNGMLPVGLGRSYGDVCLLKDGNLLCTRPLDRLLAFDPQTGLLLCEAGVSLAEVLDFGVPKGWFLPVSPGTKYVTVGGAIANDIHGKNHHIAGNFGNHLRRFQLVRSNGTRLLCSPTENPEWFRATIGGMGLTGLITWAEFQLKPISSRLIRYEGIKFHGIDEFLQLSREAQHHEYTVAWIDCVSTGRNFARGIFMQGDHSPDRGPLTLSRKPKLKMPFDLPGFALSRPSVMAFNTLYYNKQLTKHKKSLLDYEPFFYPLDAVLDWNRGYGSRGLLQFQCALPWETAREATLEILKTITKSGMASFLAVLKAFGDVPSLGMMSFPMPGITLALDFPIKPDRTFPLIDTLAAMVLEYGGRLYPAKDARMTAEQFQAFYPNWRDFSRYRDPNFTSSFWERVTSHVPNSEVPAGPIV
jgi:FAD/FMN-containing dehydrogenase